MTTQGEYPEAAVAISMSDLKSIREALVVGVDWTRQVLIEHETQFGRTTRKNRMTAEMIEKDIQSIQDQIDFITPKIVLP
jgi:hypothetical protein